MRIEADYYLLASPNGRSVNNFKTKEDGLNFFSKSYNEAHLFGIEGTKRALRFYHFVQPRIIGVTPEIIKQELITPEERSYLITLSEDFGFLRGLSCNRPYVGVSRIYFSGEEPEFMNEAIRKSCN